MSVRTMVKSNTTKQPETVKDVAIVNDNEIQETSPKRSATISVSKKRPIS